MRKPDDEFIPLRDNFMFDSVFTEEHFFRGLFRAILPEVTVGELEQFAAIPFSHGYEAHPDVYGEDETQAMAVELEADISEFLIRWNGFYRLNIDKSLSHKAKRWEEMKDLRMIFIALSDMLGAGRMVYKIGTMLEHTDKMMNDGVYMYYINAAGEPTPDRPGLNAFCHYLLTGEPGEDAFVKEIHEEVLRLNRSKEWRETRRTMFNYVINEVHKGREEERAENMRRLFRYFIRKGMNDADACQEIAGVFGLSVDEVKTAVS